MSQCIKLFLPIFVSILISSCGGGGSGDDTNQSSNPPETTPVADTPSNPVNEPEDPAEPEDPIAVEDPAEPEDPITVEDPTTPEDDMLTISEIQLVNATDLNSIATITDGSTLDLSTINGTFNFVVVTGDPQEVGSVAIEMNGCAALSRTENWAPYTVAQEQVGFTEVQTGECVITVTPYEESGQGGEPGETYKISFAVVDSEIPLTGNGDRSVNLSWGMPEQRQNGDPIFEWEIAGYEILLINESAETEQSFSVTGATNTSYRLDNLESGNYQFRIATIDTDNLSSGFSDATPMELLD